MLNSYSNGHRRAISGAGLAQLRRRMSAVERATFAADVLDGRIVLQGLTAKSIAALCGVSPCYVQAALKLTPDQRVQVKRGERPLVAPPKPASTHRVNWSSIDDNVLVEAIKHIGLDRTLDAAVAAERA